MSDAVGHILNGLGRAPIPTRDEQLHLARLIQAGLHPDATPKQQRAGDKARRRLVEGNMRLAVNIAKALARRLPPGCSLALEDLMQEAMIGLDTAARKFDPERGFSYSTYATWWIRQAVTRVIEVHGRTIRLPNNALTMLRRWRYRDPMDMSVDTFAELHDYKVADVVRILNSAALTDVKSLDFHTRLGDGEGSTLLDLIAAEADDPLAGFDQQLAVQALEAALPDDLALLDEHIVIGRRTGHMAAEAGVTRQSMCKRIDAAKRRLALVAGSEAQELVA